VKMAPCILLCMCHLNLNLKWSRPLPRCRCFGAQVAECGVRCAACVAFAGVPFLGLGASGVRVGVLAVGYVHGRIIAIYNSHEELVEDPR
jgi:hypothetical protein